MTHDESVDFDFAAIEATESSRARAHDALALAGFGEREIGEVFRALQLIANPDAQHASQECQDSAVLMELLRNVLLHIESAGSGAAMEAMLHRFAFDFRASKDESMRKAARFFGLSPEAISKRVDAIRRRHSLSPSSFNRSEQTCTRHRLTNKSRQ